MVRKIFCIVLFAVMSSALSYAAPADIPKSGQTTSYGTGSIDDGALQKGVAWPSPRFTVGAGAEVDCVTDNLTGLMWVKTPDSTTKQWQAALDHADGLDLCGHTDWRLPNVNELESLVNAEQSSLSTWLNSQGFSNVPAGVYWSSSTDAAGSSIAWFVYMGVGSVGYSNKTDNDYVWPVRSGQ